MAARDLDTKLTPALYKIFLEYKKATTKVERWLALTSKKENETKERLTIFEMKQAAERIKAKLIKVPDEIYYAFDRAIAARSEVTSHFKIFVAKETEARNASHEHFTNTLRALFEFLCPARLLKVKAPIVSTTTLSNSFAKLSTLPIENEAPGLADIEPDECQQSEAQVDAEDAGIKDDDMVQELELHFTLWDLGTTCKTVKGYWRAAAAGSMPIMLAAFLTNAAVASMAYRFREDRPFFDVLDISDYDEIIASHGSPTPVICGTTISSNVDDTLAFKSELYAPTISILLSMKGDGEAKDPGRHMMERPKDYIPALVDASDWPSRITAEMKVLNSLMRTIKRLPRPNGKDESNLVMGFRPSMRPVNLHQYFGPIPTGAAFILRLILESYKGWSILPSGDLSNSNARLHTLRFAQSIFNALQRFQASKSFEPTHGCDCTDCSNPGLLGYVRMFQDDLTAFTSEQSFDLYHQSPVVAGFQMTKLLARATELGTSFRNISQYVGAVLHLYNLLRQYGLIDPEPVLLEHLCMAIGHNIFRGPRPKLNFYSQYAAFQGAALRLDKHTRRWRMDLHGSHTRHLHPHSLCVMAGLNDCGFQPFCNRWAPVWHGIDKHGRVSSAGIYKTTDQITAHPLVCALEPLESIVRPEWEGECPVARLNWFEVYQSCTQVLENIADAQCDDPKDLTAMHVHINRNASFRCGKRSVEECLRKADQYPANEFGADYSAENKVARDAIRETFKGKIPRSENKMRCPY